MIEIDSPGVFVPTVLEECGRFFCSRPAVIFGESQVLWKEFDSQTNRVGNALSELGLVKGERLLLMMENSIAMLETALGAVKAGIVIVPANLTATEDALVAMINNAKPAGLVVDKEHCRLIDRVRAEFEEQPSVFLVQGEATDGWTEWSKLIASAIPDPVDTEIAGDDTFSLMYSSGTTGMPKGIEHTHAARQLYQFGCAAALQIDHRSVTICTTSLYANGSWMTVMPTLCSGGTVVLMERFDPAEFLRLVEEHRCTHVFMVPTQFRLVLQAFNPSVHDIQSLTSLLTAGAPLGRPLFDEITENFGHAQLYEMYGMTEGLITVSTPQDPIHGRVGSVGKPIFGGDVRIVGADGQECELGETGEIVAWSGGLMKGYFGRPDLTAELVWLGPRMRTYLRTGDLGWIDSDGFLYLSGRIKDMIISGGVNVFPSDIESVLIRHPDVLEAAVIGVPHAKWGETPLGLVILRAGRTIPEEDLKTWANLRLGKYQRLSRVEFRSEFPRAGMQKVRKEELRRPYWSTDAVSDD